MRHVLAASLALLAPSRSALAEAPAAGDDAVFDATRTDDLPARRLSRLAPQGFHARFFGTAMGGMGLRFNNPYRLSHQLGSSAESLSTTAPYADLGLGATFGPPDGLQHGGHLALSRSVTGVAQTVVTPSYVALLRGPRRWMAWGRAGLPILLSPDPNVGGELAVAAAWFFTGGLGAGASLVADGFYGAGTRDVKAAFYPVLSAQLGLVVDYEVLP